MSVLSEWIILIVTRAPHAVVHLPGAMADLGIRTCPVDKGYIVEHSANVRLKMAYAVNGQLFIRNTESRSIPTRVRLGSSTTMAILPEGEHLENIWGRA